MFFLHLLRRPCVFFSSLICQYDNYINFETLCQPCIAGINSNKPCIILLIYTQFDDTLLLISTMFRKVLVSILFFFNVAGKSGLIKHVGKVLSPLFCERVSVGLVLLILLISLP